MVFSNNANGNMNIFMMPTAEDPIPLTNSPYDDVVPRWSPDGKTIVYTRDNDQGDVYTIENYR
jgi:Tol biopolymer transport system component